MNNVRDQQAPANVTRLQKVKGRADSLLKRSIILLDKKEREGEGI